MLRRGIRDRPSQSQSVPVEAALQQMVMVAAVAASSILLSEAGLKWPSRLVFLAGGVSVAAYYARCSPWLYVTATLWFWTLVPFVRRVLDYHSGFDPTNIVLATPSAMTVFMFREVLVSKLLLRLQEAALGLLVLFPILYGLAVSFVTGALVSGVVAAGDWIAPLIYYFYILTHWPRVAEAGPQLQAFLPLNLLVMVGYGFIQYTAPPPWDIAWVIDSGMASVGKPEPYALRLFGTMNSPGLLAVWLGTSLLLALHFRTRLMLFALPAIAILLLLTLVRSVVGATLVATVVALLLSPAGMLSRAIRSLILVLLVVGSIGVAIFELDPYTAERISTRFNTVEHLEEDTSANERRAIYATALPWIAGHPLGLGIGALGRGAVAASNTTLVTIDSGPLAIYLALGWIAGSVYIIGILGILTKVFLAARSAGSMAAHVMAAAMLANVLGLLFVNLTGFYAAVTWICAGFACAIGAHGRAMVKCSQATATSMDVPRLLCQPAKPRRMLR